MLTDLGDCAAVREIGVVGALEASIGAYVPGVGAVELGCVAIGTTGLSATDKANGHDNDRSDFETHVGRVERVVKISFG